MTRYHELRIKFTTRYGDMTAAELDEYYRLAR